MKRPEELKQYIKQVESGKETFRRFVETMELDKGLITTRVWGLRFNKNDKKVKVKEVLRKNENETLISTDLYLSCGGGYRVIFEGKRYGYGVIEPLDKLILTKTKPNIERTYLWSIEDLKRYDKDLKYIEFDNDNGLNDIVEYVRRWKKYPSMELLVKNGFSYFWTDERVLKLKGKKQKEFVSWILNNKDKKLSYNTIVNCIKRKCSPEEYEQYLMYNSVYRRVKELGIDFETSKEIYKYLVKQKPNYYYTIYEFIGYYKDYLTMAIKLGKDIKSRGVLFPRNVVKSHDNLIKTIKEIADKEHDLAIKKVHDNLKDLNIQDKDFEIVLPKCQQDLVDLGEALNNCVGSCGFGNKIANGSIIILAVYKDKKPVECCELSKTDKTLSIRQLRGNHNEDSPFHTQAKNLVNRFIKQYTALQLA